jgi:Glycosyl transferase family 90
LIWYGHGNWVIKITQIINTVSAPLKVNLSSSQYDINTNFIVWKLINASELEFKINFDQDEELVKLVAERIFHILPLIQEFHQSSLFKAGSIQVNLGDLAEDNGLAFCSNRDNQILIPDDSFVRTRGYEETRFFYKENKVPWEQKKPIVFWRGATTGISPTGLWKDLQRIKLCEIALNPINQNIFDIGLSGIVQLSKQDASQIEGLGYLKQFVPIKSANSYKYIVDVDGNTNAWSALFQKLLSGSVVLKVASPQNFRQWYYDELIPWVNFVPIEVDMSDLVEKVDWLLEHDEEARKIGENGAKLANKLSYERELDRAFMNINKALS